MGLRGARSVTLTPSGVVDALDGTTAPPGACSALTNLIPDQTTAGMFQCRPAAVNLTTFAGFNTPGFVSALLVVGNIAYGMIASSRNPGQDEPFAFNLATGNFLPVSGITAANSPNSPPSTGDWTPPIMAVVGTRVVVCHPGFPGGGTKFGWFDVSGFNSTSLTATTANGSNVLTAVSSNPIAAGVQPGDAISCAGLPAGTTVLSATTTTITVSANATANGTGVALTVSGGTPTAPQWGAGDMNVNPLPSVPVAVAQFNGRAYFACGTNGVVFSDSLLPCNRTNATQALNFGNGLAVTALGALPLASPLTGGITQSIIAFQGDSVMQQITGDPVTSNLAVNALDVASGTLSPLSITPTQLGLAFLSPEGLRVIDFAARVSPPIGANGQGVTSPFINALYPTRVVVAANADTVRITTQNAAIPGQPQQEYWYDLTREQWTGPHTSACDQVQTWGGSFAVTLRGVSAALFRSDVLATTASSYVENGAQLTYTHTTALSPDAGDSKMQSIKSSTVFASFSSITQPAVTAFDDTGTPLDTVQLVAFVGVSQWGSFSWGLGVWSGAAVTARQRRIPWHQPLVFKQGRLSFTGQSGSDVRLGSTYLEMKSLNYMTTDFGVAAAVAPQGLVFIDNNNNPQTYQGTAGNISWTPQ